MPHPIFLCAEICNFQLKEDSMRLINPRRPTYSMCVFLSLFLITVVAISVIVRPSSAITNGGSILALNSPLTENFNALATAGTANAWSDNVTIGGLFAQFGAVPTNPTTYRASTGSDNTGAIYSFGSASSTDRAFGSIASGTTGDIFWGLSSPTTPARLSPLSISLIPGSSGAT